jgi:hypothetical protein
MSLLDKLLGRKPEMDPCITDTDIRGIFHNYEPRTFTSKAYIKELYEMLCSVSSYNSDKYKVSTDHSHRSSYNLIFYAKKEKIKIEISYSIKSYMTPLYEVQYVTFKDELIYSDGRWLCGGIIESEIYKILDEFKQEIEEFKERDRQLQNKKYEKYKIEQKKRCEKINKEFLELKRSK